MDTQGHQPGEELADFTEGELLSLIDAGTAGAFSEIYRRYINDAVARASASEPGPTATEAREIADNAFLSVLRSLLNGTADPSKGVRSKVNGAMVELLADLQTSNDSSVQDASANDTEESDHALVARAFSTLPDNWQRILWLREVERLSPEAAADKLNIRTTVVERLSNRAHQDLQKEWTRTRPKGSKASADHRSALIPALLTSPIVIERLSDTVAQTLPDSAGSSAARAGSSSSESTEPVAEPDLGQATADSPAEAPDAAAKASAAATVAAAAAAPTTESAPDADNQAEGAVTGAAVFASTEPPEMPEPGEGSEPDEANEHAAFSTLFASTGPAQTSAGAPPQSAFSMPKPVLIPVIAACIGLLGTLVGLAVVPQHAEHTGFRSGGEATNVSTVDTASDEDEKSNDSDSPENTDSNRGSRKPGSKNSKASAPAASDQDKNEESSRNPEDDAGRTDDNDPSRDSSDDDGDGSSSRSPDDPGPSDSDRPAPESPSNPDEPESPPEDTDDPEPPPPDTDEPTSEPPPEETDDPEPPPSETNDPEPPPEETDEPESPPETNDPPEPEPSQVDPSTGTFAASS